MSKYNIYQSKFNISRNITLVEARRAEPDFFFLEKKYYYAF